MRTHELKTWPSYFMYLPEGEKTFEVRKNDRDYAIGDRLILREWDNDEGYSGRKEERTISYIMKGGQFGVEPGYVVIALQPLT